MTVTASELVRGLSEQLRERCCIFRAQSPNGAGEFVLYWMRTAVRVDENPALEVAIGIANQLGLPLLVYHAISERYPYASDRHHIFMLQGARDVQASLGARKIGYAFHLERPEHRGPHLRTLAGRAAIVVTEEMPVEPLRSWTRALSRGLDTPIVSVDTACVVPMQLVGRAYERAFAFRKAPSGLRNQRLARVVCHIDPEFDAHVPDDLPFEPVDLPTANIAELVSQCEIDHSIGPVPHTIGGSNAGYERWHRFKKQGLSQYARLRNNPLIDGVSRMSPYLHYGMVSPMRIAREVAEIGHQGAEKYLDELLIWRELAYAFCFYRGDHERITALPDWAIATLSEHETDERSALLSWETLARGQTGDLLWDAAQKSLLMHGELHNNVRMTWGKAILNWTRDATSALATLIDLNHRYALDGRDPASYGGILWCLGQFDRPFPPARQVFGTVRDRSTEQHAKRLDAQAYLRRTTRPLNHPMPTVAVIGAGISGLMCARTLADHGFPVAVFEKSRGVGGRMATRRTDDGLHFDHGAQYFTARDGRFRRYVKSWMQDGIVEPWRAPIVVMQNGMIREEKMETDRFVAAPRMNAICRHISSGLDIRFQTRVGPLEKTGDSWRVATDDGTSLGTFDVVVVSAPAGQTAELLEASPALAVRARGTEMRGCWAVMLAFRQSLGLEFGGAFIHGSPLSWIARNGSKPGRSAQPETWVLHASPEWSHAHLEESAETVEERLICEFWKAVRRPASEPLYRSAHRWRFALPPTPLSDSCLFDAKMQVAACGDWCGGPRVEGAFLSGMSAAGRVMGVLKTAEPTPVDHVEPRTIG
jgi:photolyase PhrII